jgi:L-threonylcarbamoyladenylate synthase
VVREAADLLSSGGLVAFPTETVYGLGALAFDDAALARLFEAKGRPATDPVIVHIASADNLDAVTRELPALARTLASRFWPGPLTLVVPKHPDLPAAVTAGLPSVGVRVPSHPVAQALLRVAMVPVAAPSANRFSRPSPTHADHVLQDLNGAIDLVLDAGPTLVGVESTVLDLTVDPPLVRRPGGISVEQLREVVPDLQFSSHVSSVQRPQLSPGQLLRHYAPRARLTLYLGDSRTVAERLAADARTLAANGSRVGILAPEEDLMAVAPALVPLAVSGRVRFSNYGARHDVVRAARELFDALRRLDDEGVDEILASAPEPRDIGLAIVDRLTRAAEGRIKRS